MNARSNFKAKQRNRHETAGFTRLPEGAYPLPQLKIAGQGVGAGEIVLGGVSGRSLAENLEHSGSNFGRALIGLPNDLITTDVMHGRLDAALSGGRLATKATEWKPRVAEYRSDATGKYAQTAWSTRGGATMHPGGAREMHCYADY